MPAWTLGLRARTGQLICKLPFLERMCLWTIPCSIEGLRILQGIG